MSDIQSFEDRFARQLRSYAEGGAPALDANTVARLIAVGVATRRRTRGRPWPWAPVEDRPGTLARVMTLGAAALIAVVGVATLLGGVDIISPAGTPAPSASVPVTAMPTDSAAPAPQPSPSRLERVAGWPGMGGSGPGLYSWQCSGRSCDTVTPMRFMHNCYGPCDVAIVIGGRRELPVADGSWSEVSIAGHRGWYRRVVEPEPSPAITTNGPLHEVWVVEINGVTLEIRLYKERDASAAGLADAHAIIDSLRQEPGGPGLKLVFRLTNSHWDSG